MFEVHQETLDARVHRYRVAEAGRALSRERALMLLQSDEGFRALLMSLLRDSPFAAFRWETPAIVRELLARPFEFVLVDSPELAVAADAQTFAGQFAKASPGAGVVTFANLGGDATLVVPAPLAPARVYSHLAAFLRGAPPAQVHALWAAAGREVTAALGDKPLWVSTAGGGVAWVHVRLDARPKYYAHGPYRAVV